MSEYSEKGETRNPKLIEAFQKALSWDASEGIRWDYLDDTGITTALGDADIEWLGTVGLKSADKHTRELAATFLGLGHLENIPSKTRAMLEHMALHETDFDQFPPARFRAAAALWEHGDKRPELRKLLEEVSRREWTNVERHTADRMAIAAETYLQDIPRRSP